MPVSNANKLGSRIASIKLGQELAEVTVQIPSQPVTVTITRAEADNMHLREGDNIVAMFNSTVITLIKNKEPEAVITSPWNPRWMNTVIQETETRPDLS